MYGLAIKTYQVVSECKDTRFECNSQLKGLCWNNRIKLFQNAKIQDLNVIHNRNTHTQYYCDVVSECKDTRFECNSQLASKLIPNRGSCFRMQRYKI